MDNLKSIIERQKEVLAGLEAEQRALENSDLAKENAELRAELDRLRKDFGRASESEANLKAENASLRNSLYEQIYNEKIKIVDMSARKMEVFFHSGVGGELNRLAALERNVAARIESIRQALVFHNISMHDELYVRLNELTYLLNYRVADARARAGAAPTAFSQQEREALEAMKNEQLSDEQIRAVAKKNNLERFIGLNVLNFVGILLLIIGAIAFVTYDRLTDLLRGILLFALGGGLLSAGEFLNRKKPSVFSLGLSAGGIGVLYTAMAMGYFSLDILDTLAAGAICLAITAGAFLLSNRYNSQVILIFALIGGYAPIFAIGDDITIAVGVMAYFVVLNILVLLISFRKRWRVSSFIGLFLNIVGTLYIAIGADIADRVLEGALTIIYVMIAFFIYSFIPIVSTYRTKGQFRSSDIVFLSFNTICSSAIMFGVFVRYSLMDYYGLLALVFAVIYLVLGIYIKKLFQQDEAKNVTILFYLTGYAFIILFIPLQFGEAWMSLGWLVEGVLLIVYGVLTGQKAFERAGYVIGAICLIMFVFHDSIMAYFGSQTSILDSRYYVEYGLFFYKYLSVTLGSLVVLGAYMYKRMTFTGFAKWYKYFVFANAWIYALYMVGVKLKDLLFDINAGGEIFQMWYISYMLDIVATIALAYFIPRVRLLNDSGTKIFSTVLYAIGIILLFYFNAFSHPVAKEYLLAGTPSAAVAIVGTIIIIAMGAAAFVALRDALIRILAERALSVEAYPLILSGFILLYATQALVVHYGVPFASAVISIIYILTALAWIVYGFLNRYSLIRKSGLFLALFAVIKLFLVDLSGLAEGYRIISYFALGFSAVAISYAYQFFSKRLELKVRQESPAEDGQDPDQDPMQQQSPQEDTSES